MRLILLLLFVFNMGLRLSAQHSVSYGLTVRDGLIDNSVYTTVQDKRGFMWFGTWKGLCRYDTKNFKTYKNDPGNPHSLSADYIRASICDSKGTLWFGTSMGLSRYDPLTDSFDRFLKSDSAENTLSENSILSLAEDRKGNLWVGTINGANRVTTVDGKVQVERFLYNSDPAKNRSEVTVIYEDPEGIIWMLASSEVIRIDLRHGKPRYERIPGKISDKQQNEPILAFHGDKDGNIWVGTKSNGLGQFDRKTKRFHSFRDAPLFKTAKVNLLTVDRIATTRNGTLWLKTNHGLLHYNPATDEFKSYSSNTGKNSDVPYDILQLYVDPQDELWVGTFADGVKYITRYGDPFTALRASTGSVAIQQVLQDPRGDIWFQSYGSDPMENKISTFYRLSKDRKKLEPGPVVNGECTWSYFDKGGTLWLGLSTAVMVSYRIKGAQFEELKRYQLPLRNSNAREWITYIAEDRNGLVVGTYYNGVYTLNKHQNRFLDYNTRLNAKEQINDKHIGSLMKDSKDNFWIGTSFGIYRVDGKTNKLTRFQTASQVQESSSTRTVNFIHEDNKGRIWMILSNDGLYLFEQVNNKFLPRNQSRDIAGYNITNLQHDEKGNLWLNNALGIVEYNPTSNTTRQYFYYEGIPGSWIMSNSCVRTRDGTIYMTTNSGAFYFHPEQAQVNQNPPSVVFTNLRLFNKPVSVGDHTNLLKTSLSETGELTFRHNQSIFTVDFAVLNFIHPEKNQYAYKLEGLEKDWNYVSNPTATYTNLPAESYTLLIKGANNDGVWSAESSKLKITVLSPWWNTWYAWVAYLVLAAIIVFYVGRFLWIRSVFRKEKELQEVKLNFFTNISHEIRTRLMLISGPLERMLRSGNIEGEERRMLGYVNNSADSLLNLVNELMDFRKMESGVTPIVIGKYDLIAFVKNVMVVFEHESESKGIRTSFVSDQPALLLWYDSDQLEKVIYNLLANAYKFTAAGGEIIVAVRESGDNALIEICDNGVGIAPEHLDRLFENYFQVDESKGQNTGYGMGLALSKSIMEKLKGSLTVKSTLANGDREGRTVFTVTLRKGKTHFNVAQITPDTSGASAPDILPTRSNFVEVLPDTRKDTILLAEDNDDLRAFVSEALGWQYKVIETSNGKDAWEVCAEQLPDLVISDVMMAEMNGLELCRRIKSDIRTSHVPVILLTARTALPSQIEGLQFGADLYLTKPLSMRVLELNIRNLLQARSLLQQKYSRHISLSDQVVNIGGNKDDQFLNSIIRFVEDNIENKALGIPELCRHVGMSKSVLYQKVRALTDLTINDFFKLVRFKLAARLLKDDRLSIQEVASLVGYDDRKYFSKEFKKQFGKTPSEYASEQT